MLIAGFMSGFCGETLMAHWLCWLAVIFPSPCLVRNSPCFLSHGHAMSSLILCLGASLLYPLADVAVAWEVEGDLLLGRHGRGKMCIT
jgi:hypothetical protein